MRGFRLGILGPRGPFGERLRELLGEGRLPVTELKLLDAGLTGEATLTHVGDDVVVTQPLDPHLLPHLDALFVSGEDGDSLNRIAGEAAADGVLTLVHGAVGLDAPVLPTAAPERLAELDRGEGIFLVPRAASFLLGTTLGRLQEKHPVRRAVATVLLPARESGDAGAEELHQQVVHLLNFKSPPTDVLREQLAFNVRLLGSGEASPLAEAVAAEASAIAGLGPSALTVSLVQVPVFHGYSATIWVELEEALDAKTVGGRFRTAPFEAPKRSRGAVSPSPVSISESERIHMGSIRRSGASAAGPEGFWLWSVADSTAYDPAVAAVEAVKRLLSEKA